MNFLAHIYLSGDDDQLKLGNFIGDYVKGKAFEQYPERMQKGIRLHRHIDHYTDHNPHTSITKKLLTPKYRHYAGILIDIFYDHFLAVNWDRYSPVPLLEFINHFHDLLQSHQTLLPARVQQIIPSLIRNQRLYSYRKIEGIENALTVMSEYTSLPNHTSFAIEVLKANYDFFNTHFIAFFDDFISHLESRYGIVYSLPEQTNC